MHDQSANDPNSTFMNDHYYKDPQRSVSTNLGTYEGTDSCSYRNATFELERLTLVGSNPSAGKSFILSKSPLKIVCFVCVKKVSQEIRAGELRIAVLE